MSDSDISSELILARWSDRLLAWLIDFLIISIFSGIAISVLVGKVNLSLQNEMFWTHSTNYIPTSLIFFLYWLILEYRTGQSIGKRILRLKITDMSGKAPDIKGVAISSFGKSFLLPIDVVLGWIFTNKNRQRLFNKMGNTLIVKMRDDSQNINYRKD